MVTTITEVLNIWNEFGVFSYVIPFLLIFAVVFAILKKTKILGEEKGILAIVSAALGLLALQFDLVSEFYAVIFPRFGIGLSVFLVTIIFIGFFVASEEKKDSTWITVIGAIVAAGVVFWSIGSWGDWVNYGFMGWIGENIWAIVILVIIIGAVAAVVKGGD